MYNATLRILCWDNVEDVMISAIKTFKVNNAEGFKNIFDTYCRVFTPDNSGNNCPDAGYLNYSDPERAKQVIKDINDIK